MTEYRHGDKGHDALRRSFTLRDGYLSLSGGNLKHRRSSFTPDRRINELLSQYNVDQFICGQPDGEYYTYGSFEDLGIHTDGTVKPGGYVGPRPFRIVQNARYVVVDTKVEWYHDWNIYSHFPEIGDLNEYDHPVRTLVTIFTSPSRLANALNDYRLKESPQARPESAP